LIGSYAETIGGFGCCISMSGRRSPGRLKDANPNQHKEQAQMTSQDKQSFTRNNGSYLLKGKHAVVFGAGGSVGAAVAKAFAAEGAEVFLAGRNKSSVDAVAKQIAKDGGIAHAQEIDASDQAAVNAYLDGIVLQTGSINVAFTAIGPLAAEYGNGKNAVDLPAEQFMVALENVVKPNFITASAAARHMLKQRSGAIIFLTGSPARGHVQGATAIGTAFGGIESLMENLAVELGPNGVRVVCLRTTVNIDTRTIQDTMGIMADKMNMTKDQLVEMMASLNFLKIPATTVDTAQAAVFLASDRARLMTGTVLNSTAGAALD
jgi:3-oxoacyl-[acyl-carrier protein] reductase